MTLDEFETHYHDSGWYIRTAQGRHRFVAWAKREMFVLEDILLEPGDVYFEFGQTRERAVARLLAALPKAEGSEGPAA